MSNVSRSVYQKQKELAKKLLNDIRIIVGDDFEKSLDLQMEYVEKFRKEKEFGNMMHQVAKEYLKKHPEYDINKLKQ